MNDEFTLIGSKHINSWGNNSQFWADYYYRKYRNGSQMVYQLRAVMRYVNTAGGTGRYDAPVVTTFKINVGGVQAYNSTKQIKPATSGYFANGTSWAVDSDWFPFDKTTGVTPCEININNSNTWGFDDPNYSFDLPIDPALASIVVNGGNRVEVDSNENVGKAIPVILTKPIESYVVNLKLYMETSSETGTPRISIGERTNFTGSEITLKSDELQIIYTNTPKNFFFRLITVVETYQGESKIGQTETLNMANLSTIDLDPTFTNFVYSDWNPVTRALTDNGYTIIKGYSTIGITVAETNKAIGRKGATITKYTGINGSNSVDYVLGDYPVTISLEKAQSREFSVWAIDSRDKSTKVDKIAVDWIEYTDLTKNNWSVQRDDGGVSKLVKLSLSGSIFNGDFGKTENSIKTATYKYKKTTDSEYTTGSTALTLTNTDGRYSFEGYINGDLGANGFSQDESFDILIEITDELSKATETLILQQGSPAIDIYGNCVALGRPYDEDAGGRMQGTYEVGDVYITFNPDSNPAKRFGGTWEKVEEAFLFGASENYAVGTTGGEKEVTLTIDEMPKHNHGGYVKVTNSSALALDGDSGGGNNFVTQISAVTNNATRFAEIDLQGNSQPHNNMPPYIAVYIWRRTA